MEILRFVRVIALLLGVGAVLVACNSTDATFGVDTSSAGAPLKGPDGPAVKPPSTLTGIEPSDPQFAAAATVRIRWAPVIGAPVDKVTALSRRISARARAESFAIVASTDPSATHVLKGYFSVLSEGTNSTVVYVFDILDPAGNRLHRIQGQETVSGSNATDPWASIPAVTLDSIADKTVADFAAWQRSRQT